MNQITINVKLYSNDESKDDVLAFLFEKENKEIHLNTDSCQVELKEVFSKLLTQSLENDVILKLIIEDNYNRGLYKDVCTEYIAELQRELNNVRDAIRKEIAEE
jgi:hypothetical protein